MSETLKLGKAPATVDPRDLKFAAFRTGEPLPPHPRRFGHENLIPPSSWGMLKNDAVGDCVIAEGMHTTKLWVAEAGGSVSFTDANALAEYSAITGYDPNDESTDRGTNMRAALNYRRKTGLVDATGKRHKIGAFVALQPGNLEELMDAIWLFGSVSIGFRLPSSAMDQFKAGKHWAVVRNSPIEGGHCVPGLAIRGTGLLAPLGIFRDGVCVTWAKPQGFTLPFYEGYCDEAYAVLSPEMIRADGMTIDGFDLPFLSQALAQVATV